MKNAIKLQSKKYFLGFIQLILAIAILTGAANAATYVVTNTADSGAGSFRQAILNSNANVGTDTINFNIAGSGVHTIFVQGVNVLPEITDSVTINGTTQPGYAGNPLIEIDGSNTTEQSNGITIKNGNVIIKALVVRDFKYNGIFVRCIENCDSKPASLILTGSRIGTNSDGTADAGNYNGIEIWSGYVASSQIGGTGANERNVISGNIFCGIQFGGGDQAADTDFLIINNMIGTNLAGTNAIPNDVCGISSYKARLKIGGDAPPERNVISGNTKYGIGISGWAVLNGVSSIIEGNYIGTNAAGTAALGFQNNGISVSGGGHNRIGGLQPGTGNVVSGNVHTGISFNADIFPPPGYGSSSYGPSDTLVYGNKIGTNAAGTAAVGNGLNGISVIGNNNSIGLSGVAASSNIISGNGANGVQVFSVKMMYGASGVHLTSSKGNKIQLNYIGTNPAGADLGNGKSGILVYGDSKDTLVGGGSTAENAIAFNDDAGVSFGKMVYSAETYIPVDAQIKGNKIYSNGLRGIQIYENDAEANDAQDADEGFNNLQNAPVLSGAYSNTIIGSLHSTPNKTFNLDFYSSPTCDDSGRGEGQTYLDSISVTTDASGNAGFETFFGAAGGSAVTATATAPPASGNTNGSTSEFSQCVTAAAQSLTKISFSQAAYSVGENGATATITVTRAGGLIYPASVNYATAHGGTATVGQDYTSTTGTLNFNAGQSTKTFTVPIANDTTDEPDETVNLSLSNPSANAVLINPSSSVLTIADNDNPPSLSIKNFGAPEGTSGTKPFTFDVTLSEASGFPASIKWMTSSNSTTATPGDDYTAADGTLNFAAGETSKQITVLVNGDTTPEPNESFLVMLYAPVNVTVSDSQGVGGIHDDDNPGELKFSPAVYNVNEGVGTATVTVTRTTGTVGTVTVDYATTNTGTTSSPDFTPASGTLTFPDGEATKAFSVSITDDQIVEQDETINLVLSNVTGGAAITGGVAQITVADNDQTAATSISGNVNYAITPINQSQKKVSGVLVYATGPSNGAATSDSAGAYQINNLTAGGQYTVVASKTGDFNGITPFDATLVLRHVAANGQGANALSANQQLAADANNSGTITPFDATLILRFVAANGKTANTGAVGDWKFAPASQSYASVSNSLTNENYEAVLIGEVNGSWTPPANSSAMETGAAKDDETPDETNPVSEQEDEFLAGTDDATADAEISLPIELSAANGEDVLVVPVLLTNYAGRNVSGYSFDLRFDPTVLQPDEAMAVDTTETLSQGLTVVHNASKSGRIGVAVSGGSGGNSKNNAAGAGTLLKLRFKVIGAARGKSGGETALSFRQTPVFEDGEGDLLKVKRTGGTIRVSAHKALIETPLQ